MGVRRCRTCREYIAESEVHRWVNLGAVCSEDCERALFRKQKKRKQAQASKKRNSTPTPLRKTVKERDGYSCRMCGVERSLQVHHIFFRSQGGEDVEHNLITLCHACHEKVHSDKKRWQPPLLAWIWLTYVEGMKRLTVARADQMSAHLHPHPEKVLTTV